MDPSTLDSQSTMNSLLNGADGGLIPETLVTSMIVGFVLLNILGLLFFIVYVSVAIRNWKVQSAVFQIQKDLAALTTKLSQAAPDAPKAGSSAPQTLPTSDTHNKTIAKASNQPKDTSTLS